MPMSRPVILAAATLSIGFLPPAAQADPPAATEQVQPAESQEQLFDKALDREERFRIRQAKLVRLRALAFEQDDAKRVAELDRLLERLENKHERFMYAQRRKLGEEWRERLDDYRADWREAKDDRSATRQDRHEARVANPSARHAESDGAVPLRGELHDEHRAQPDMRREASGDMKTGSEPRRPISVRDRADAGGDPARVDFEPRNDPANTAEHFSLPAGAPGMRASVSGKRPVPPPRPAPGASLRMAAGGDGPKLSTRREAGRKAAAAITRENAEAEFARLRREIENDDE